MNKLTYYKTVQKIILLVHQNSDANKATHPHTCGVATRQQGHTHRLTPANLFTQKHEVAEFAQRQLTVSLTWAGGVVTTRVT